MWRRVEEEGLREGERERWKLEVEVEMEDGFDVCEVACRREGKRRKVFEWRVTKPQM